MRCTVEELRFEADRVDHHFFVARAIEHVAEADPAGRVVAVGEDEHDLAAVNRLEHLHALVDRVVEPRRVAELQIVEREDQIVAIVGELAAELNLVAEGAHLTVVGGQHAQDELLRRGLEQIEVGRHAGAVVEHHDHGERLHVVLEERDVLRLAVVEDR